MTDKIKVLIVDDSSFVRVMLNDILSSHPDIEVIGNAQNGKQALRLLAELTPDVITLDVEMPFMNGFETLKEFHKSETIKQIPVIMCSSLTASGTEATLKALELGAFDFIQKPENNNFHGLKDDIYSKVFGAAAARKSRRPMTTIQRIQQAATVKIPEKKAIKSSSTIKTVVISISTGGPASLNSVIPYIPANLNARFLVIQHMPAKFTEALAERLNKISLTQVSEAKDGEEIKVGNIYIAPGNYHMCINSHNKVVLNQGPTVCGVRPSANVTLKSCVEVYGKDIISVVMTGMGNDGTDGTVLVKQQGGYCIAQDEQTSVIYGMPKSVVKAGLADEIVPLQQIADRIVSAVSR